MRDAFFRTLAQLAQQDDRVHLVVGDLGFGVTNDFVKRFPGRFLNVGVAEQNMTGVAAGMALSGKIVFTYSIANFPILRCLEQVRNDVCYHKANVTIVAVGGGFSYGALGATHHATEDLAIMRSLPEMVVLAPGDPAEAEGATEAAVRHPGPCYLRLGRAGEPKVHDGPIDFRLGKAIQVCAGADVTLISTGAMLKTAVETAALLRHGGLSARVLSMHTVKPIDAEAIIRAARDTQAVFTLEEHSIVGGLGGAVAEVLAESLDRPAVFKRFGLPPAFSTAFGSQEYLREQHGLAPESLARQVHLLLEKAGSARLQQRA